MSSQVSESSLTYLKDELGLTVDRVQQSLEAYSECSGGGAELGQAGDYLRQIAGVLVMLDRPDGARFARELAELAEAIGDQNIADSAAARETLLQEALKLEPFLDSIDAGDADDVALASSTDRIRALLGKAPVEGQRVTALMQDPKAIDRILVRQLRPGYQRALVQILRGQDVAGSLAQMTQLLSQLADMARAEPAYRLWWTSGLLLRALRDQHIEHGPAALKLLGGIDRAIKDLIDQGESGLGEGHSVQFLAELQTALGQGAAELLADQHDYHPPVPADLPATPALINRDTLGDVASTLGEDISLLQDTVDRIARADESSTVVAAGMAAKLGAAASVLSMLNMSSSASLLSRQRQRLDGQGALDQEALERLAADLVLVETSLSGLMDPAIAASLAGTDFEDDDPATQLRAIKHRQALMVVTEQAGADVDTVQDITTRMRVADSEVSLSEAVPLLHRIANVFSILGHDQAALVSDRLRQLLTADFIEQRVCQDSRAMTVLAEAMVGLEYFLKGEHGTEVRHPRYLSHAEDCLDVLEHLDGTAIAEPTTIFDTRSEPSDIDPGQSSPGDHGGDTNAPDMAVIEDDLESALFSLEAAEPEPEPEPVNPPEGTQPDHDGPQATPADAVSEPPPAWLSHEFLDVFLEEAEGEIAQLRERLPVWRAQPGQQDVQSDIRRAFHTLKGSGRMVGAGKAGEFACAVEEMLNRVLEGRLAPDHALVDLVGEAIDAFAALVVSMQQGAEDADLEPLSERISTLLQPGHPQPESAGEDPDAVADEPADPECVGEAVADTESVQHQTDGEPAGEVAVESAPQPDPQPQDTAPPDTALAELPEPAQAVGRPMPASSGATAVDTSLDPELAEVFVQEAADILESSDVILDRWAREPQNLDLLSDLRREMHTLKGSSRMAGFLVIGDLAHAVESLLDAISRGELELSSAAVEVLQRSLDRFHAMLPVARRLEQPEAADDLVEILTDRSAFEPGQATDSGADQTEPQDTESGGQTRAAQQEARSAATDAVMLVPDAPDMVRVKVELLDRLGDQIGESSIFRARIAQGVNRFDLHLKEMDQTVGRLSEKLRRLEIETEAQILFRYERDTDLASEEFDPLELDRFSELQQLSRSLMEVVNDLNSIRHTMDEQGQELEVLLHQQAKVNHEIQEGLTRTRMVRFDSIVPRMRRVVRQAADELGKRVDLVLQGSSEMERSLLEHVVGPLEHILRNAVSHGIEEPALRLQQAKPERGRITLDMRREGSELILDISDDGAGINFDAVRRKAEKAGLLQSGVPVAEDQLIDLLLMPGFSTAEQLTQVSGRGVGMDVVNEAVRELGGSLGVDSEHGRGARFVMRLPFSLSIAKALLVNAGGDTYAVPLAGIEAMTRIAAEDVRAYAEQGSAELVYGDASYRIHSLGALLGGSAPQGDDLDRQLPAMLVRSEGINVAFQVDAVLGNEETIVKPVGPQVNSVPGLAGATILGDGRVVLLLEMAALVRNFVARATDLEEQALLQARQEVTEKRLQVMVVDDSITMRKVTSRLLERHDVDVLLAKDGLDAAGQLEDIVPDAMVLDIEMPRMDGFELAAHIRNQEHLAQIPIIMVTSRSGDKHRQRAMDLGVNAYLGKPYREDELLKTLREVLGDKAAWLAVD